MMIMMINETIMMITVSDNTGVCSLCSNVGKIVLTIIDNTKNITYIYWQSLRMIIM